MALVTLHTIFQDAFPAYEQTHPLPAHVHKAARAIMPCRTAALGGHIHACPNGHVTRVWDNSCRHRSCPQCTYLQTERWLALQQARLLACDHSHVIFTLPHDLNPLWLAHVPVMRTLLFQAVRDTLRTLLAAPKYLGAQPGIIAARHTWSQTLVLHPPLHCLVTGGGCTPAGTWVAVRNGSRLPMRVVMAVVQGKMVDAIRQTCICGALTLPEPMRPQQVVNLLNRLGPPMAVHDVAGRRLSPAVAAACPRAPHSGGTVVWALPPCPHRGAGPLSRRARATACGAPHGPGRAHRVCPTGRRASRTGSHLRSTPGVHRCHPAWGGTTACPCEGARRMQSTHDPLPRAAWQGAVCLACALWWPVRISGAVVRRFRAMHTLVLAVDQAVPGGHRPDDGGVTQHNLHSVRGATLVGPGRYAGSPTRS